MEWSGNDAGNHSPRPGTSRENYGIRMETQELGMGGEPVQLHDVLADLRNVDTHQGTSQRVYGQNRHNVKGLVLACVQAALSMVKDKEENTSKETDRVALVLKLLHQEQVQGYYSYCTELFIYLITKYHCQMNFNLICILVQCVFLP